MRKKPLILKTHIRNPDKRHIRKAAKVCKKGGVIAFPTETVYIVGGRMSAAGIEKRLREITGRPETDFFVHHVSDWSMLEALQIKKTPLVRSMVCRFWPGPVTLVVPDLLDRRIGVRFSRNKIACMLIREIGEPLITAGANRSGESSPHTAHQVVERLHDTFDCLIDGGKTEFRFHSTIVDLVGEVPVLLRKGAQAPEVEKAVLKFQSGRYPRKRVLILCTGNICRSPMAEGLLKHEIEKRELSGDIEVISCGTRARDGVPCTSETASVMQERGIDLSKFRSRLCRGGDLWTSNLVIAMTPRHALEVAKILPSAKERMITLNVGDPIGKGMDVYEKTCRDMEMQLKRYLDVILGLKTENKRQRTEDRRQKTDDKRPKAEDRRLNAEDRRRKF